MLRRRLAPVLVLIVLVACFVGLRVDNALIAYHTCQDARSEGLATPGGCAAFFRAGVTHGWYRFD